MKIMPVIRPAHGTKKQPVQQNIIWGTATGGMWINIGRGNELFQQEGKRNLTDNSVVDAEPVFILVYTQQS